MTTGAPSMLDGSKSGAGAPRPAPDRHSLAAAAANSSGDPLEWLEAGLAKTVVLSRSRKREVAPQFAAAEPVREQARAGTEARHSRPILPTDASAAADPHNPFHEPLVRRREASAPRSARTSGTAGAGRSSGESEPSREPLDGLADLERAIAEISARQSTLEAIPAADTPLDQKFAALRARASASDRKRSSRRDRELDFEEHLEALGQRLDTLRRPCGFEDAAAELRRELAEIGRALKEALPRKAIEGLEQQIQSLADRIETTRGSAPQSADRELDRKLNEILGALRALSPAENLVGFDADVRSLARKVDAAAENGADGEVLQHLELAISELRGIAARAASGEALAKLADDVRSLAGKVERLTPMQGGTNVSSLEQRIDALATSMRERPEAGSGNIESLVKELSGKLGSLQGTRTESPAIQQLDGRISKLTDKLEASDARFASLGLLEKALSDVFTQLETTRAQALEVAEHAAKAAAREIAEAKGSGEDVATLKTDLDLLREKQQTSDKRTHDTLEAVHSALERLVGRLATIEHDIRGEAIPHAAAEAPEELSSEVRSAATALQGERRADPNLPADHPIEPGSRVRDRGRAARGADAHEAPGSTRLSTSDPNGKASFIAAARRAAQAAAELEQRGPKGQAGAKPEPAKGRRARPLLIGIGAFLLIIGVVQIGLNFLNADTTAEQRDAPAKQQGEPTRTGALSPAGANIVLAGAGADAGAANRVKEAAQLGSEDRTGSVSSPLDRADSGADAKARSLGISDAVAVKSPDSAPKILPGMASLVPQIPADSVGADLDPTTHGKPRPGLPASIGSEKLRAAALGGDPDAEYEVAIRYFEGRGVPQNFEEAGRWFERAAARGLVPARYRLASQFEKGQGYRKDPQAARALYLSAAEKGHGKAMHNLAVLYAEGVEGKPDFKAASGWFRKAATRGVPDSQYNLGILYARGIGVEQNLSESYLWFSLAASQGDQDAAKKRDEVGARLDQNTIAAAKAAVKAWVAEPQPADLVNVKVPDGGWDQVSANPAAPVKTKQPSPAKKKAS